jgi:hypothetical protein
MRLGNRTTENSSHDERKSVIERDARLYYGAYHVQNALRHVQDALSAEVEAYEAATAKVEQQPAEPALIIDPNTNTYSHEYPLSDESSDAQRQSDARAQVNAIFGGGQDSGQYTA